MPGAGCCCPPAAQRLCHAGWGLPKVTVPLSWGLALPLSSSRPGPHPLILPLCCRGKPHGHDVDLLLSHPEEGREVGLLGPLVAWLEEQVSGASGQGQLTG